MKARDVMTDEVARATLELVGVISLGDIAVNEGDGETAGATQVTPIRGQKQTKAAGRKTG